MTRRTLAARIAALANLTGDQVARVLGALPIVLATELAATGKMHWRGLGSFAVRTYPPRRIHNPATGQTIELPSRTSITFKPSPRLRSKLKPADSGSRARRAAIRRKPRS